MAGLLHDWQNRVTAGLLHDWQNRVMAGLLHDWQNRVMAGLCRDRRSADSENVMFCVEAAWTELLPERV
jgi:hypothetical protein